jgi:hypothetical protein
MMNAVRASILLLSASVLVGCTASDDSGSDGDDPPANDELTYVPIVQYVSFQFQGRPVVAYIPEDVKAFTWLFHGTNGGVEYAKKLETIATTNLLIPEGIGFVCSESLDQGPDNSWDKSQPYTDSVDAVFLLELYDYLVDSDLVGRLEPDTPQYTLGFSGGGDFSGYFANALLDEGHDVRAVASHSSAGHIGQGVPLPEILILPVNDENGRSTVEAVAPNRVDEGLRTDIWEPPEIVPLPADWWTRNPSVTPSMSEKTFSEMVRLGLIDEDGMRLVAVEEAEAALTQWEKDAEVGGATLRTEETMVAWALHRMNGYYAREVRDFFLDYL